MSKVSSLEPTLFRPLRRGWIALALLAFVATGLSSGSAFGDQKGPTYRRNRGKLVWQAKPFAAFSTEKELGKMVRKARRGKTLKANAKGRWTLHFIAFLRKAPGAGKVNLVWYRLGKKREQVDFTEFNVSPEAVTLQSKATLSPTAGFKAGDRVEGRITRIIGGKEKVYARCRIKLK